MNDTSTGPSLLRKAANFGKAVVKHVADGGKHVTDEVYLARLSVCANCPSLDPERMRLPGEVLRLSPESQSPLAIRIVPIWKVALAVEIEQSNRIRRNKRDKK